MDVEKRYTGSYEKVVDEKESGFDWNALLYWLGSLIVSLIPLYLELIKYLNIHDEININFWSYYFIKGDILWVFATLLLFVLVDSNAKKRKKEKKWVKNTFNLGIVVFVFTEATFIIFNALNILDTKIWPLYIGVSLVIISLVISTPLKIEFIKED